MKSCIRVLGLLLLAAVLVPATVFATGVEETGDELPAPTADAGDDWGWKADTSPITFDWYFHVDWYTAEWSEDTYSSALVTDVTGVDVNIQTPTGDPDARLNLMIASDSLPDMVSIETWIPQLEKVMGPERSYSLYDLADAYDPYFYNATYDSVRRFWEQEDGELYGYPNTTVALEQITPDSKIPSSETILVRKDIYEALGEPDLRTPEGLLSAMIAAKEQFPEVDGRPLIPIGFLPFGESGSFSLVHTLRVFVNTPREVDGEIGPYYFPHRDPEWVRWMKTLREANELGLISRDVFVDEIQQIQEKTLQGRYFILMGVMNDVKNQLTVRYDQDPDSTYIAVPAFYNSDLETPQLPPSGSLEGWMVNMITRNNRNPERAIEFFTYLVGREHGQTALYLGKEGETWDYVDGTPQIFPEIAEEIRSSDDGRNKWGLMDYFWFLMDREIQISWAPPLPGGIRQPIEWTHGKVVSRPWFSKIYPTVDTEEGIALAELRAEMGRLQPQLLLAETEEEFDELLAEFIEEEDEELPAILAAMQEKLEQNKEKFGVE